MSEKASLGPLPVRLQHGKHILPRLPDFVGGGADDMAGHDRRRRLAQRTGFDHMGEIADDITIHAQEDLNLRPAELGMLFRGRIGVGQNAASLDIAGKFQDLAVVDVVHARPDASCGQWRLRLSWRNDNLIRNAQSRDHFFTVRQSNLYKVTL